MLSVIIPVYVEPYLNKTIDSVLNNATGEVEVIPVFDGVQDYEPLRKDSRIKRIIIDHRGMRAAINTGIQAAQGDYVMKLDAHCDLSYSYDENLTENCQEDWLMTPVCYMLNEKTWTRRDRSFVYHYLSFPGNAYPPYGHNLLQFEWNPYPEQWQGDLIGDTMNSLVGCWIANRKYYLEHIHPLNDSPKAYGPFTQECLELGLKYWLGGGAVKVNKNVWYAHLWKRPWHWRNNIFNRMHRKDNQTFKSCDWATRHWMNDREPKMVRKFSWLVEKFWPVPTWPDNWQDIWAVAC